MPASDPLTILLRHDHWATRQIIDAAATLPPDALHRRFDIGPGSLHDTLIHICGAMRVWTDVLHRRDIRPRPEGGPPLAIPQIRALLEESAAGLQAAANLGPLPDPVTRTRDGKTYTYTRGAVLTHITTHSTHHRAQCLNMLRHLGVTSLPQSSVTEWTLAGEP